MGRRKLLKPGDSELTVRQLIARHGIDPFEEMMLMLKQRLPWPEDEFLDKNPGWLKLMFNEGWAPHRDENGKRYLALGNRMKLEIYKTMTPHVHAQQKAVEVKSQNDYNISVTINYGTEDKPKKVEVESTRLIPEAVDVEVKE